MGRKRLLKIAFIVVWVTFSFLDWGMTLGQFTNDFPAQSNTAVAAVMAAGGPLAFPACAVGALAQSAVNFRVRPLSYEQRWEAFHCKYPILTRQDFEKN